MVEEPPEFQPPRELVYWAVFCQFVMCVSAGLLLGFGVGLPAGRIEARALVFLMALIPFGIIFVLYRSVFRRARLPAFSENIWLLPSLYVLIMLLSCLALPYSIPFMILVSGIFAMIYNLIRMDLAWQRYLVEHDVPPRNGFTLRELMMGFVGLSIALAVARMVAVGTS